MNERDCPACGHLLHVGRCPEVECECVTTEGPLGEPQGLMPGLPAPEPPAALRPTLWGDE